MSALLEERSKRQREKLGDPDSVNLNLKKSNSEETSQTNLKSLVESVKRKSAAVDQDGVGKRRKT